MHHLAMWLSIGSSVFAAMMVSLAAMYRNRKSARDEMAEQAKRRAEQEALLRGGPYTKRTLL
jgi:uncharacterized protein YpmB